MNSAAPARRDSGYWWLEPEVLLLLLLVTVGYFVRMGDLTSRGEESRRATVAQEFLRTNDWLAPRQQGEYYFSRPPLQNWLIAGVALLRGDCDIWAARLPSVLAVTLTTLLLYGYSRTFLSRLGAFTAAAAFPTMAQVLHLGGTAETDSLFTLFVSGSLLTWHWGWSRHWPAAWQWTVPYVFVALGTLTKGPQAPVYFAASVGAFLILNRRIRDLFTWSHLLGLAVYALIFGAWLVPYVHQMGFDAARRILGEQAAVRYRVDNVGAFALHLVTYPMEIAGCLMPWTLCLIPYLNRRFQKSLGDASPNVRFLLTCLVVTFPTLWLAQGGQGRYWMPLFPCWAPLVGLVIQRCAEGAPGVERRGWTWFVTGFAVLLVGIAALAVAGGAIQERTAWSLRQPSPVQAAGLALALVALAALLLRLRSSFEPGRLQLAVFALAVGLALCYGGWYLNILISRSVDTGAAVAQVKSRLGGAPLVSLGTIHHLVPFYYREHIARHNWPKTRDDVPADLTYFCFDIVNEPEYGTPPPLPFAWEPVAIINCDRNVRAEPGYVVVVGRKLPAPQK